MLIQLPRPCTGQEILKAFQVAGTFVDSPQVRWESRYIKRVFRIEPAQPLGMQQVLASAGACTWPLYPGKRYIFWGETLWSPSRRTWFHLEPVILDHSYTEITLNVGHYVDIDEYSDVLVRDHTSPMFAEVKPQLNRIILDLFERLKPKVAATV